MIQKYTIHGEPKSMPLFTIGCKACKDGEKFKEERYRTDTGSNPYFERICGECLTKYKIPYIDLGIQVEALPGTTISKERYDKWAQTNGGWIAEPLNEQNQVYHTIKIGEDNKMQGWRLEQLGGWNIPERQEEFEKTGVCKEHLLIQSKPFKTYEGEFSIVSCAVCKLGRVTYKGQLYEDSIMNLVRYLAHMGTIAEKNATEELNLFGVVEETPLFQVEEKPVFSVEAELPVFEVN